MFEVCEITESVRCIFGNHVVKHILRYCIRFAFGLSLHAEKITIMNLQHPSFQDIFLIHAAVQANEEEERAHSQPAKPLPSQESRSSLAGKEHSYFGILFSFVIGLFILCILLAFILS